VHRFIALLSLLACLSGVPALASAQEFGSNLHIGAGLALDLGGDMDFDLYDERLLWRNDDLDATFGVRGHADYRVHRFVSVGGLVRMSWWKPDDYPFGRSFLFDIGPRVIGHYDWRAFRFYGGISPGLTISVLNDDPPLTLAYDNPSAGFTLSFTVAGAEWWFRRDIGLFLEMGYVGHWFSHDVSHTYRDADFTLGQMMLETGFVFGT
jgi:hypothetical protein